MTDVVKMSRVLVGVDFDEASAAALKMAASLAAACDADLTVFHAAIEEAPVYFTTSQIDQLAAEREQRRAAVIDELRTFAERQAVGAVNVVAGEGPPQDALLRTAPGFDLIAVGTHRRHGAQRWWLGSVAEAIVRHSPRPVLVVPTGVTGAFTRRPPTILVAGGEKAAADAWADLLGTALGGNVVRSSDIQQCAPDRLQQADLIVLSMPAGANHSHLRDIARVLRECVHPVLFVPSLEAIAERSS